jgi:hypothetical protein
LAIFSSSSTINMRIGMGDALPIRQMGPAGAEGNPGLATSAYRGSE